MKLPLVTSFSNSTLELVKHVVVTVEVLDDLVAQQVVEVPWRVVGEQATLLGHRWYDDEPERREHGDQSGEDDRHGQGPSQPAPVQRLDRGLRARVRKNATSNKVMT